MEAQYFPGLIIQHYQASIMAHIKSFLIAYYNKTGNKDAVSSITAGKTDVKKTVPML